MSDTGTGRGAFFKEFAIILLKFLVFFCVPLALLELVIGDNNEAIWTVITVIGLILFGGWYYDELTALIWPSWFLCVGLTFAWVSIAYLTGHIKEPLGLLFVTIPYLFAFFLEESGALPKWG